MPPNERTHSAARALLRRPRRNPKARTFRPFALAGLAATLAVPVFAVVPASAAQVTIFSCTTFTGDASLTPGMIREGTADGWDYQELVATATIDGCDNGQSGTATIHLPGHGFAARAVRLACPVALGGVGPDAIPGSLVGRSGGEITVTIDWATGEDSTGVAKIKAGATGTEWRWIFGIYWGQYSRSFPDRTRIKATVSWVPTDSYTCADNSDPISSVSFSLSDPVNQPSLATSPSP